MRFFSRIVRAALLCMSLPTISGASDLIYTGTMKIIATSGEACQGLAGTKQIELMLRHDQNRVEGYFEGPGIALGKFSGSNISQLDVQYPNQDELTATGHFMSIVVDGDSLTSELRDRHLEPTEEDCSFDLARMTLVRSKDEDTATRFRTVSGLFDAKLMRSKAIKMALSGRYAEALPFFEKALAQILLATGDNPFQNLPYVTSLIDTYVKLGRVDDFNKVFDQRVASISNKDMREIYIFHGVHFLLQAGRASLQKQEYSNAMVFFQKAYHLSPQNGETGAGVMMVYLHTGRIDDAISFLEGALKTISDQSVRQDMNKALANIYLKRANKFDNDGSYENAAADLVKADSINPGSTKFLIALARLRHKNRNMSEAEKILQQGLERFQGESSRKEIIAARDKMQQVEAILEKLRKAGAISMQSR